MIKKVLPLTCLLYINMHAADQSLIELDSQLIVILPEESSSMIMDYEPNTAEKLDLVATVLTWRGKKSGEKTGDDERSYVCTYPGCSSIFKAKHNLTIHMRSHTGERPYKCTWAQCTKAFTTSSKLTEHHKIHLNKKEYACDLCVCRFNQLNGLKEHKKKNHDATHPTPKTKSKNADFFKRLSLMQAHHRDKRMCIESLLCPEEEPKGLQ